MLKFSKLMLGTCILCLGLAGCGTSDNEKTSSNEHKTADKAVNGNQPKKESKTDESAQTPPATTEKRNQDNQTIRVMEQNLQYSINGAKKEETAFLQKSDNQGFSMYVLPDYELTAEEPMKDIVFLKNQDDIFMRIELLPSDNDWKTTEDNTKTQLKVVSDKITAPENPELKLDNSVAFQASNQKETVTAILIKNPNNPIRITMFTKNDQDFRSAFLEMAKTIKKEAQK